MAVAAQTICYRERTEEGRSPLENGSCILVTPSVRLLCQGHHTTERLGCFGLHVRAHPISQLSRERAHEEVPEALDIISRFIGCWIAGQLLQVFFILRDPRVFSREVGGADRDSFVLL